MVTRLAVLAACAQLAGCMSYYSDGPGWSPPKPSTTGGYVVVYRPAKQWGQLQQIEAKYKSRTCRLYANAYCVFYFPPGEHSLLLGIPFAVEVFHGGYATPGAMTTVSWSTVEFNPDAWKRVDVRVEPGQTVFVRTEVHRNNQPPETEIETDPDLDDVHLAPGGLARDPIPDLPVPASTTSAP